MRRATPCLAPKRPAPGAVLAVLFALFSLLASSLPAYATEVYDMRTAVQRALSAHPLIESAQAGLNAAEAGRRAARGAFGPSFGVNYGYSHVDTEARVREGRDDVFTMGASVKQNLFTGLRLLSAYERAALERDQQDENVRSERISLAGRVQEGFLALLKARERLASAEDTLVRLREQRKVAQGFYENGLSPRLDVLQAEVDVSDAEAALLVAQNTLATAQIRLNTLLVLPLDADVVYTGSLEKIAFDWPLERCLKHAFERRPDIIMAGQARDIARQDRRSAESAFFPQLSADLGWSSSGDSWRAAGSSWQQTDYTQWSVGVNAQWELFSWGTTYYAGQQRRELETRARAQEDDLRQEISYEVSSRLLKLQETGQRVIVMEKTVTQAHEAFRMAKARYAEQIGTNRDVLDAQASLSLAESGLTDARAEYLDALSKLWAALGELKPDLRE